MRKALLAIIAVTVIASPMHGKPRAWVDGSAVISTAYLWRGDRVTGFHAAPDLRFHLGKFTLENYSFLALDGSYKEIDWDLSFTVGDFTFHAADYFARYDWYDGPEDWFSWKKGATNHIDEVVRGLISAQYDKAYRILQDNLPQLHALAKYLYEHETITGEEFMDILHRTAPQIAAATAQ